MHIALYFIPVGASLIMSFGMLLAKSALKLTDSPSFMFFRSFAGFAVALCFLPFVDLSGIPQRSLLLLVLSIVLVPFSMNLLFFNGVERGDLGAQNALLQTTPAFVVLLDILILSNRPELLSFVGLFLIVIAVLILTGIFFTSSKGGSGTTGLSILFGVGAAAVNGVNLIILSEILPDTGRALMLIAQNLANVSFAGILYFRRGGFVNMKGRKQWKKILLLSLGNGILVRVVYFNFRLMSLELLGPIVTSALLLSQVLFTYILSSLILREKVTIAKSSGVLLIVAGALIVTLGQ